MSEEEIEFIYHYCINGDKTASQITEQHAPKLAESEVLWQHLDLRNERTTQWFESNSGLDSIVVSALMAEETRPRSFAHKDGLLIVLRGINMNPGHDAEEMVSIRLWLDKNRIVSARFNPILSVKDILAEFDVNQGPKTTGEFLTTLVDKLADRIGDFVNEIENELGLTEDELENLPPNELRSRLGSLRRQIAMVRRFMAPQRDALDRLNYLESPVLSSRDRQRLREESDRVSRYLEDLDLARERAIVLQEAFLSQIAQQQNSRMYVLSVVAAIFLPLTFVTGLLGMNVGGLPGLDNPRGFLMATIIMLTATASLIALFKWRKWI